VGSANQADDDDDEDDESERPAGFVDAELFTAGITMKHTIIKMRMKIS
jgi:hypothetical protein